MKKEIIMRKLAELCQLKSIGNKLSMESVDRCGHREPTIFVKAYLGKIDFNIKVRYHYQSHGILVGIPIKVKDFPELALQQFRDNDEVHYGCPHHYELSEDKTKILYVRHGTNGFGETQGRYVEKEYENLFLEASFSKEELNELPLNGMDTYHESTAKGILIAGKACEMLYY